MLLHGRNETSNGSPTSRAAGGGGGGGHTPAEPQGEARCYCSSASGGSIGVMLSTTLPSLFCETVKASSGSSTMTGLPCSFWPVTVNSSRLPALPTRAERSRGVTVEDGAGT